MPTRPNVRTLQMQDTIDRQKRRIEALEAAVLAGQHVLASLYDYWVDNDRDTLAKMKAFEAAVTAAGLPLGV